MRVAFYAPLKPPDHPVPSGDRRIANLIMRAFSLAGHEPYLASTFRSFEGRGEVDRQTAIADAGAAAAQALIRRYRAAPRSAWPEAWFTYHVYHKSPDWLGPAVSLALDIPYLVAEASHAPKQADGPWASGYVAAGAAIAQANVVLAVTTDDFDCLRDLVSDPTRLMSLAPFLDSEDYRSERSARQEHRTALARELGCDERRPWILSVAMMRHGDKLDSFQRLGKGLARLRDVDWQLLVVGEGEARRQVEDALAGAGRVIYAGARCQSSLPRFYVAADVLAWPAVNEAYGMALLEAQASGLPVVAGRERGVPDIVRDGETGLLTAPGDVDEFAVALRRLLQEENLRRRMSEAAADNVATRHDITRAARILDRALAISRGGR